MQQGVEYGGMTPGMAEGLTEQVQGTLLFRLLDASQLLKEAGMRLLRGADANESGRQRAAVAVQPE